MYSLLLGSQHIYKSGMYQAKTSVGEGQFAAAQGEQQCLEEDEKRLLLKNHRCSRQTTKNRILSEMRGCGSGENTDLFSKSHFYSVKSKNI